MNIRDLLILILALLAAAAVIRGLYVAWRIRYGQMRLAIDKNIPQVDLEKLEMAELPNGGARVVPRTAEETAQEIAAERTATELKDTAARQLEEAKDRAAEIDLGDDEAGEPPIPVLLDTVQLGKLAPVTPKTMQPDKSTPATAKAEQPDESTLAATEPEQSGSSTSATAAPEQADEPESGFFNPENFPAFSASAADRIGFEEESRQKAQAGSKVKTGGKTAKKVGAALKRLSKQLPQTDTAPEQPAKQTFQEETATAQSAEQTPQAKAATTQSAKQAAPPDTAPTPGQGEPATPVSSQSEPADPISAQNEPAAPTSAQGELAAPASGQGESATSASSQGEPAAPAEIVVINVMAKDDQSFSGAKLLEVLMSSKLKFGNMKIFHSRLGGDDSPIIFSVANILNPGTFNLDNIAEFSTVGLSFFMGLPSAINNMEALDSMLQAAQHIKTELDGELKDDQRSIMTAQTIEHYRQRIRDFELRSLKASSKGNGSKGRKKNKDKKNKK
ncbi:MAG: cell division protein ZipA [Pseudohongiellaceae bacterium]